MVLPPSFLASESHVRPRGSHGTPLPLHLGALGLVSSEYDAQHFGGPDDSIRWCGDPPICRDVGDGAVILRATSPGEVRGARESLVERDAYHRLPGQAAVWVERHALDGVLPVRRHVRNARV